MKYRMLRGIVLVASFTLFASYEPQISTAATVTISPSTQYQTMDGIGACSCAFPYGNDGGWNWNSVKFVFDELDLHYIRLVPWMYWWEKYNDNADPNVIYWPGFGVPNNFAAWYEVPFAKYLTSKGIQVHSGAAAGPLPSRANCATAAASADSQPRPGRWPSSPVLIRRGFFPDCPAIFARRRPW